MSYFDDIKPQQRKLIYWLMCLGGIDLELAEVEKGRYFPKPAVAVTSAEQPAATERPANADTATVLDISKSLYTESVARKDTLDKKVASLLSLTGLLLPLTITLFVYTLARTIAGWVFLIGFVFVTLSLLACAFLLLEFLGIGQHAQPGVEAKLLEAKEDDQKFILASDYRSAADFNHQTCSYLADVYRAARRFFIIAFLAATILGLIAAGVKMFSYQSDSEKRLFDQLKNDPELVSLLRGEKGASGKDGKDGRDGKDGKNGANGDSSHPLVDPKSVSNQHVH